MVGLSKSRFLRDNLPKEVLCNVCKQVLKEPLNCKKCELFFCQSCTEKACSHNHKCSHEYMEANKFIKNKIDELQIKCVYCFNGCTFTSKVSEIEKHEEICELKKTEELSPETKEHFDQIFRDCPISIIHCEVGCKKEFKHLERDKKETADWLVEVVKAFEKRQQDNKIENNELLNSLHQLQKTQQIKENSLNTTLQDLTNTNQKLQSEFNSMKNEYEQKIKQLEAESAFKMKIFHENSGDRVDYYADKIKEAFKGFEKELGEQLQEYWQNLNRNIEVFNSQIDTKISQLVPKIEKEKQTNKKIVENNKKEAVLS